MGAKRNCSQNTASKYMQNFRSVILDALKSKLITDDPFVDYKIEIEHKSKGYLTIEEIEKIANCTVKKGGRELVRDVFLFCCYTGLSYVDVRFLDACSLQISGGKLWIRDKRTKTEHEYDVPLVVAALKILKKYEGKVPDGRLLPVLSNTLCNDYIKEIAAACGITKKVTFHLSRHTFATLALNNGVSLEVVSRALGHINLSTTQKYANIMDSKIAKEMNVFESALYQSSIEHVDLDTVYAKFKIKLNSLCWRSLTQEMWNNMPAILQHDFVDFYKNKPSRTCSHADLYKSLQNFYFKNIKH
jgi:site-specific recombinase XerD